MCGAVSEKEVFGEWLALVFAFPKSFLDVSLLQMLVILHVSQANSMQ